MLLFLFFRYKFNCKENFYWSNLCWRAATMSPESTTINQQQQLVNGGGIYGNNGTTTNTPTTYVRNRRNNRRQIGGVCNCLMPIIRFWGVITAIGKFLLLVSTSFNTFKIKFLKSYSILKMIKRVFQSDLSHFLSIRSNFVLETST